MNMGYSMGFGGYGSKPPVQGDEPISAARLSLGNRLMKSLHGSGSSVRGGGGEVRDGGSVRSQQQQQQQQQGVQGQGQQAGVNWQQFEGDFGNDSVWSLLNQFGPM